MSMAITKFIAVNNKKILIKISSFHNKQLAIRVFSDTVKLLFCITINSGVFVRHNSFLFVQSRINSSFYHSITHYFVSSLGNFLRASYSSFLKLYVVGLGYKNFTMNNCLYILVGDSNYIILKVPFSLKTICKKNQIYLFSKNKKVAVDFIVSIQRIKKLNFYKGKGILQFKNFKFCKLKVGKKQRFM